MNRWDEAPRCSARSARVKKTSVQVAKIIFGAVADGTDRLLYIGTPDIVDLVRLRREADEEANMKAMREAFAIPI